eukprot:TRINITY_DN26633_c0_g1_i1.p1 TRINITY_DN26633_c0_g1~~TRINITY_DN26633_c0_g1_i1.p1  ORF type:complete len:658 (+),score=96.28 TRINITY_DN26633_c0_g1_i1:51-2024(+)
MADPEPQPCAGTFTEPLRPRTRVDAGSFSSEPSRPITRADSSQTLSGVFGSLLGNSLSDVKPLLDRKRSSSDGHLVSLLAQASASPSCSSSQPFPPKKRESCDLAQAFSEAVWAVRTSSRSSCGDSLSKDEDSAASSAFVLLKKSCSKIFHSPEILQSHSSNATIVVQFLIGLVARRPSLLLQVCEVLNMLLSSEEWVECLSTSTECQSAGTSSIVQQITEKLPQEFQAALGVQNDALLELLPEEVRRHAFSRATPDLQAAWRLREDFRKQREDVQETRMEEHRLRFKSSVQELRFEGSDRGSHLKTGFEGSPNGKRGSAAGWRAMTTEDGSPYYYHAETKETRSEPPSIFSESVPQEELRTSSLRSPKPGERVEVFSNTAQQWCTGYVEKIRGNELTIAFKLSDARSNEWSKKSLMLGHPDLRIAGKTQGDATASCPSTPSQPAGEKPPDTDAFAENPDAASGRQSNPYTFHATDLPTNWTDKEIHLYGELFAEAESCISEPASSSCEDDCGDAATVQAEFFRRSALPQRALREVWQVANPDLKTTLGLEEFRACCRLIGHCQSMARNGSGRNDPIVKRLRVGGCALRSELRNNCLSEPPLELLTLSLAATEAEKKPSAEVEAVISCAVAWWQRVVGCCCCYCLFCCCCCCCCGGV